MITEDGIYKLKLMGAIGFCERLNNSLHLIPLSNEMIITSKDAITNDKEVNEQYIDAIKKHLQSIVDTGKTAQAALDSLELMDHI